MNYYFFSTALIFLLAGCKPNESPTVDPEVYYTCSMDPQVVEYKPGKCPICKMELTPVKINKGANQDELELSDQQITLGNIRTDTLEVSVLGEQLLLSATLNFDQRKTNSVSSRVMGRIDKLYYKNLGDFVLSGMPLYDLYSEELNSARHEYIQARENKNLLPEDELIKRDELIHNAKNKLILLGMTENQILQLNSLTTSTATTFLSPSSGYITELGVLEGDYTMAGGPLIKLADLSTLWAEAQIYSSQLNKVNIKSKALVRVPDLDNKEITGTIEFVTPELNADSRILLLRVTIPNPGGTLKPGMSAQIMLQGPREQVMAIPSDAAIRGQESATVWIQSGKNKFKPKMVNLGRELNDSLEILSGITAGELVVVRGAYLLNSEYILKKGADPMASHAHNH